MAHGYIEASGKKKLPYLTVNSIAKKIGVSVSHLSRVFREDSGYTLQEYLLSKKMEYSRELLLKEKRPIKEVASIMNFSSVSYFTQAYKRYFSDTPFCDRRIEEYENFWKNVKKSMKRQAKKKKKC